MAKVRKPRTPRRAPRGKVPEKNYDDWVHNQMVEINAKIELEKKQIARYHIKRKKLPKIELHTFPPRAEPDPRGLGMNRYHASTQNYRDWNKIVEKLPAITATPTYKQAGKQHDAYLNASLGPQTQFSSLFYMHGSKAHTNSIREVSMGVVQGDKQAGKIWDTMRSRGGGFEKLPSAKKMSELWQLREETGNVLRRYVDKRYN